MAHFKMNKANMENWRLSRIEEELDRMEFTSGSESEGYKSKENSPAPGDRGDQDIYSKVVLLPAYKNTAEEQRKEALRKITDKYDSLGKVKPFIENNISETNARFGSGEIGSDESLPLPPAAMTDSYQELPPPDLPTEFPPPMPPMEVLSNTLPRAHRASSLPRQGPGGSPTHVISNTLPRENMMNRPHQGMYNSVSQQELLNIRQPQKVQNYIPQATPRYTPAPTPRYTPAPQAMPKYMPGPQPGTPGTVRQQQGMPNRGRTEPCSPNMPTIDRTHQGIPSKPPRDRTQQGLPRGPTNQGIYSASPKQSQPRKLILQTVPNQPFPYEGTKNRASPGMTYNTLNRSDLGPAKSCMQGVASVFPPQSYFTFTPQGAPRRQGGRLSETDVLQVEMFYRSHKSEVFVCASLANMFFGSVKSSSPESPNMDEWTFVKDGVPVLILDSGESRRQRKLFLVLAEKGTGFILWKDNVNHLTNYKSGHPHFHTLHTSNDHTRLVGFSFDDPTAAAEFYQRIHALTCDPKDTILNLSGSKSKKKKDDKHKSKHKVKAPNKSDISSPCCFTHVTKLDRTDGMSILGTSMPSSPINDPNYRKLSTVKAPKVSNFLPNDIDS